MTIKAKQLIGLIYQPWPKWVEKACDRIAAKRDDEPLTNTEAEALIITMSGPVMEDEHK